MYELVEVWDPGDEQVVARSDDRESLTREASRQRLAGMPTGPDDIFGPDYYVREAK